MFLCPFWPRIPPRKTSCHVSLVSCQSGMVLSVLPLSRFLTALPFPSVGWPSTCMCRLAARFLGSNTRDGSCAPSSASCQEGHPSEVLATPSTWTSPSLPGFSHCKVTTVLCNRHLAGRTPEMTPISCSLPSTHPTTPATWMNHL